MAILRGTYYFDNVAGNYLIAKNSAGITKANGCTISNGQITRYVTESELLTPIEITLVYSSAYINVEQFYGVLCLQKVVLDDSSWTISSKAFELSGLENIELGAGVYSIGENAFKNSKLKYITSRATTPPQIVNDTFNCIPTGGTLYYPAGSDYSTWLSTSPYYLGYYGWNGSEIVEEPTYPNGEITAPYDTINISSNGDTLYYIIKTNNIQYLERVYTDADFITVTMIGEDVFPETTFKIEIAKNETSEKRSGSVWFTYMDWNNYLISHTLTITQDAKYVEPEPPVEPDEPEESPSINLEFNNLTAPTGGVTTTLVIETNGVEDIEIIAPEWVEVTDKGGYYEIEVLPNEGTDREGEVIFIGNPNNTNKVQQSIIITQKGNEEVATSIALYKTRLDYTADGGSEYLQVDYVNAQTINAPYCSQSWVTIEQTQSGNTTTNGQPTTQVQYRITMQPSSFARQTNITFSCVGTNGNTVSQNKFMVYQEGKEIITTVTPTTTLLEFPYSGGTKTVQVNYTNPNGILEPVPSQSWISVQFKQSGSTTSGTDAVLQYQYAVTMAETENARQAPITFRCYDINGNIIEDSHLICSQEGEPVIESDGVVSAFKTIFRVNADGSPEYSSDNYIRCGYSGVTISEPTVSADWINLGKGTEETGTFYGYSTVMYHTLSFDVNEGGERTGTITFKGTDSNGIQLTSVVNITQYKAEVVEPEPEIPEDSTDETFSPIWKDIYYEFMSDTKYEIYKETYEYLNGIIYKNDELIYSGKIYLPPKEQQVRVHINKICQNYFADSYLPTDGAVGKSHNYETFKLKNEYGTLLHTYHFVNDWSYEPLTLGIKTNPIIPNIVDGQMLFFSVYATEQKAVKWGMRYYNGDADYDNTEYVKNDFYTNIVAPSRQKGVKLFYVGNNQYYMIPKCKCQYVLYYLNPYGGFDWFPVLGRVTKKDKVTQYTYTNNYNNNTTEFGKYRYLTEISTEYNLNTGFLTESQSDRMWELMESNCVYLHNVVEDKIYPVLITDTDIEYKKKIRGRKMLSYSINVELSQTRERI